MASSSKNAMARRQSANQPSAQRNPVMGSLGTVGNSNMRRPPGASMNAQVAFSQAQPPIQNLYLQQQQQLGGQGGMQKQQMNGGNSRNMGKQQMMYQETLQQEMKQPPKISISDAIGLTTMRLSKVEEQLIEIFEQMKNKFDEDYNQNNYFSNGGENTGSNNLASNEILSENKRKIENIEQIVTLNKKDQDNINKVLDSKIKTINLNMQKQHVEQNNLANFAKENISKLQNALNDLKTSVSDIKNSFTDLNISISDINEKIVNMSISNTSNPTGLDFSYNLYDSDNNNGVEYYDENNNNEETEEIEENNDNMNNIEHDEDDEIE